MRLLYLLLGIIGFLNCKAQWENMPVGTKLHYSCNYIFIHTDDNESEDSVRGSKPICLKIDTIFNLNGKDRKIVLFSDDFDPSGIDYVDIPKKYSTEDGNLNKGMCTMFYFFKHAIYGLYVSKKIKNHLKENFFVKALDDSLKQAVYYSTTDTIFSNYLVKYKGGDPNYWIKLQGCEIYFTPFQFLLKDIHKKKSNTYSGEDPYFDFFCYYSKKGPNVDEYILIEKLINSQLLYSSIKGFLQSNTDAAVHNRQDHAVTEMKLERIEYP